MKTAFLTGSRVYGTPRADSDTDLVVLVSEEDMVALQALKPAPPRLADAVLSQHDPEYTPESLSLKFGPLNLICTTDPDVYAAWKTGTDELFDRCCRDPARPTRDEAVKVFKRLFAELKGDEP